MKIRVSDSNKVLDLNVNKTGVFSRGFGLMFKSKNTENLLFEFNNETRTSFTGLFVFFPFLILWLDKKNNVVEKKMVRAFEFSIKPKKNYRKVVEVPVNEKNREIIDFFVGKSRRV